MIARITAAEAAAILRDLARGREDGNGADVWPLYERAEDAMAAVVDLSAESDAHRTRADAAEADRDAQRTRAEAAEAEVARLRALLDADPVGGRWRRRARAWAERIARAESERDDARAIVGEAMAAGLAECDRLRESLRWYWNERAELLRAIPRD